MVRCTAKAIETKLIFILFLRLFCLVFLFYAFFLSAAVTIPFNRQTGLFRLSISTKKLTRQPVLTAFVCCSIVLILFAIKVIFVAGVFFCVCFR